MTACLFANTFENLDETDTFLGEKKKLQKSNHRKERTSEQTYFYRIKREICHT